MIEKYVEYSILCSKISLNNMIFKNFDVPQFFLKKNEGQESSTIKENINPHLQI